MLPFAILFPEAAILKIDWIGMWFIMKLASWDHRHLTLGINSITTQRHIRQYSDLARPPEPLFCLFRCVSLYPEGRAAGTNRRSSAGGGAGVVRTDQRRATPQTFEIGLEVL